MMHDDAKKKQRIHDAIKKIYQYFKAHPELLQHESAFREQGDPAKQEALLADFLAAKPTNLSAIEDPNVIITVLQYLLKELNIPIKPGRPINLDLKNTPDDVALSRFADLMMDVMKRDLMKKTGETKMGPREMGAILATLIGHNPNEMRALTKPLQDFFEANLPKIEEQAFDAIEQIYQHFQKNPDLLKEEGPFRVSGTKADVDSVTNAFLSGIPVNLYDIKDPNIIIGVFKQILREQFTFPSFDRLMTLTETNPTLPEVVAFLRCLDLMIAAMQNKKTTEMTPKGMAPLLAGILDPSGKSGRDSEKLAELEDFLSRKLNLPPSRPLPITPTKQEQYIPAPQPPARKLIHRKLSTPKEGIIMNKDPVGRMKALESLIQAELDSVTKKIDNQSGFSKRIRKKLYNDRLNKKHALEGLKDAITRGDVNLFIVRAHTDILMPKKGEKGVLTVQLEAFRNDAKELSGRAKEIKAIQQKALPPDPPKRRPAVTPSAITAEARGEPPPALVPRRPAVITPSATNTKITLNTGRALPTTPTTQAKKEQQSTQAQRKVPITPSATNTKTPNTGRALPTTPTTQGRKEPPAHPQRQKKK